MTRPLRVLVVGAGPAGLALAQGLRHAGAEVAVYERDATLDARPQGYRILLNGDGWASLRSCLPAPVLAVAEATSGELHGPAARFDHQLRHLGDWGPDRSAEDLRPVDRAVLRHVLMLGLDDHVSFGRRFVRFEDAGERVRVVFADGGDDVGDVVVGADGGFSAVRRVLHPEIGFVHSELVAAMGRTPADERFGPLSGGGALVEGPGLKLTVAPMVFRTPPAVAAPELPATASYLRWLLMLPPDHPVAQAARRGADQTVTGADARDAVLDLVEDWHPLVRDLVASASTHNGWMVTPKLLDRPLPPWDAARVTLVGDAAHLTLPSGGNGLATALRDAATLLARLTGGDDVVDALRAYQEEMLVYGRAAVEVGVARQRDVVPRAAATP